MAPRQEMLVALVGLADTLDHHDIVESMHRLAVQCVDLLDTSAAGIMLSDRDGTLKHVAASNEAARLFELDQLHEDQGPSLDAYRTGLAVHSGEPADLARSEFASVSALPMKLRSQVIGVLDLFSTSPDPLQPTDQLEARALADVATIGILQERALRDERLVTSHLETAITSRVVIEQAKGIVAERLDITMDAAFTLIRRYTRSANRSLSQTASGIIAGEVDTDTLTQWAAPAGTSARARRTSRVR